MTLVPILALLLAVAMTLTVVMLARQLRARRLSEVALVEHRDRLSLALSAAGVGTWRWTVATDNSLRDGTLSSVLGGPPAESVSSLDEWFEQVHPEDRQAARETFDSAVRERRAFSSEFRVTTAEGAVRWLRVQGRPYESDAGVVTCVTGIAVDVTDRKLADEALRASKERFAKAFAATPDCIALSDFETGILEVNARFESLTGYTREEIIGRTIADLGLIAPEGREVFLRLLRQHGKLHDYELQLRRKDGAILTALISAEILEVAGRSCFLSVSRDISEQRRLEQNLTRASEINRLLVSELEPDPLYAAITQSLHSVLPIDYACVVLRDETSEALRLRVHTFYGSNGVIAPEHGRPVHGSRTPPSVTLERGELSLFSHADLEAFGEMTKPLLDEGIRTLCCAPLRGRRRQLGVVCVGSRRDAAFTAEHTSLLSELATYIAIAIDNAHNHEQVLALKNQLVEEKLYLEEEIRVEHDFSGIIGNGPALRRMLHQIRTVAPTQSTVLLLGETGTGKELLARSLHALSPRSDRTFVKVNAASLPATLLESELFGYDRGAFTGATTSKVGRFELANRGTLFLDEIGDLPIELQPKLLRVLQEREFERLGGTRPVHVDVRLIAATNRDLEVMVADERFRSDLFYRLNVFPVHVPPLRDRREDIPALVRHFVRRFATRMKRNVEVIPAQTMEALQRWHWPGNIRELENVIERAVILSTGAVLKVSLPEMASPTPVPFPPAAAPISTASHTNGENGRTYLDAERETILRALRDANGVIAGASGAAARLGLKRTTLHSKMRKLGIRRSPF
jgi:formate hydrogenlyase transcriptional activator